LWRRSDKTGKHGKLTCGGASQAAWLAHAHIRREATIDNNIVLVVLAVVVAAPIAGVLIWRQQQSKTPQRRFGAEYERTLETSGAKRETEAKPHKLENHVEGISIRPLTVEEHSRFTVAEDPRLALRRYRSFFSRPLSV
jgi:hypothetical protein